MQFKLCDWTCERIEALEAEHQLAFAQRVSGSLVQARVLQGRCLLVIQRAHSYENCGASSVFHYASLKLGLDEREVREVLLVAARLENLPLLTEAVERDQIVWSRLRSVLRRATPETEAYWLEMARRWDVRVLERLLRRDAQGSPGSEATSEPEWTQLKALISIQEMGLLQRAIRDLSIEAGKRLSLREALECLAAERLSGKAFPDEKTWEKLRHDVERDLQAKQEADLWPTVAEEDDAPAAPWAAVAAVESDCPGAESLQLVRAARVPHWENERLQFNEDSRLVTPAQRREILRRDGYRCSVPECPHLLWLQVHHVVFYCEGGATVPENLVSVCARCHRHIHRGLLQLRGEAPHGLRWFDRLGRELGVVVEDDGFNEPAGFEEEFVVWLDRLACPPRGFELVGVDSG